MKIKLVLIGIFIFLGCALVQAQEEVEKSGAFNGKLMKGTTVKLQHLKKDYWAIFAPSLSNSNEGAWLIVDKNTKKEIEDKLKFSDVYLTGAKLLEWRAIKRKIARFRKIGNGTVNAYQVLTHYGSTPTTAVTNIDSGGSPPDPEIKGRRMPK